MAAANSRPRKPSPLMIGVFLGLGLMALFLISPRSGDQTSTVEPRPWRVLTVNNSAVRRSDLPIRVICSPSAATASGQRADCYLRVSMHYNPEVADPATTPEPDCQLEAGFVSLVVGIGDQAVAVDSQPVDLAAADGGCNLQPGVVVNALFNFQAVPQTEKLSLVRFVGIQPQLELTDNLRFVAD